MTLILKDTRLTWLVYILFMGAVTAACFGSATELLLDTHDDQTFQDNLAMSRDFSYFFLPPEQKVHGSGRPVEELVKFAAFLVKGNDPAWFHLLVVITHGLAALLVAHLARRLGMSLKAALAGGLLFLVNVTHFQVVHWISAWDYSLALIASLLAVLCYQRYLEWRRIVWMALFGLAMVVGLMTHISTAAVLPFCLYWAWHRGEPLKRAVWGLIPVSLLLVPVLFFVLSITARSTSTWQALEIHGTQGISSLIGYGEMLLWFTSRLLTTAHWLPLPVYEMQSWELVLGGALLAGLGWLVRGGRFPEAPLAVWIVLAMLPFTLLTKRVILDLPVGPSRYLYMATAGSSLLLARGIELLASRWRAWGRLFFTGVLVLLLSSSYVFIKRAEALSIYTSGRYYIAATDWKQGIERMELAIERDRGIIDLEDTYARLCIVLAFLGMEELEPFVDEGLKRFPDSPTLEVYRMAMDSMDGTEEEQERLYRKLRDFVVAEPTLARVVGKCYNNLGRGCIERKEYARAAVAYKRSLIFAPGEAKGFKGLGLALVNLGKREQALGAFAEAVRLDPQDAKALYGAAMVLNQLGRLDEAVDLCRRAAEIQEWGNLLYLMGDCLEQLGRLEKARAAYERGMELDPENAQFRLKLTHLELKIGEKAAALRELEEAVRLQPEDAGLRFSLGNLYYEARRMEEAVAEYEEAVRLEPGNAQAYANLATAQRVLGRLDDAVVSYEKAIELASDSPVLHHNLGSLLLLQGDKKKARKALERAIEKGSNIPDTYRALIRLYGEEGLTEEQETLRRRLAELESAPSR